MIPRLNKDSPLCPHVNMTDSTKTMSHTPWMGWGEGAVPSSSSFTCLISVSVIKIYNY